MTQQSIGFYFSDGIYQPTTPRGRDDFPSCLLAEPSARMVGALCKGTAPSADPELRLVQGAEDHSLEEPAAATRILMPCSPCRQERAAHLLMEKTARHRGHGCPPQLPSCSARPLPSLGRELSLSNIPEMGRIHSHGTLKDENVEKNQTDRASTAGLTLPLLWRAAREPPGSRPAEGAGPRALSSRGAWTPLPDWSGRQSRPPS